MNLNTTQFVILTCDKYLNTRIPGIINTWAENVNYVVLTDTPADDDKIIGYNTPKTIQGIQDKYLNFFKKYDFNRYDYYFFTDDDTFVNLSNFNKLFLPPAIDDFAIIRELILNPDCTDKWGNFTGYPLETIKGYNTILPLTHPSGGAGFILSQKACLKIQKYLLTTTETIPTSNHGDVTIGFWLRNCSIRLIFNENLWWEKHEVLTSTASERYTGDIQAVTFHYVNPELMAIYHERYN